MSISAPLLFAIGRVTRDHPDFTPDEVCDELRRKKWEVDDAVVIDHLTGALTREQDTEAPSVSGSRAASAHLREPHPLARVPGFESVDLAALPPSLERAVRELAANRVTTPSTALGATRNVEFVQAAMEMIEALTAEIAATAETSAERRAALRSGRLLGAGATGYTARWEMESEVVAPEGGGVKLAFSTGAVDAEVVQIEGNSIALFVSGQPTKPVSDATLILDASFLLDLRRRFLLRLVNGDAAIDGISALSFLADAASRVPAEWSSEGDLNAEQEDFVCRALAGGVTWLWGPPGTGKTMTLAYLIKELRRRDLRTLFVSNTNAAVDAALSRVLDVDSIRRVGDLVRIGQPSMVELSSHSSGPVLVDGIAEAQGIEAGAHLAACRREIADLQRVNSRLIAIIRDPSSARDRGWFGTQSDDLFDLKRLVDEQNLETRRDETEGQLGFLVERRRNLEALVGLIRHETINQARVVFATVHQTYLRALEGQRFDVIVIDEASMVSSDLVAIASGLGSGHLVIAGDFRQLGPIAQSESHLATRWLRTSPFERAGIRHQVIAGHIPENLVALTTQHRMRAGIQQVIGDSFYREVGLRAGPSVAQRAMALPTPMSEELVLVDTSSLKPWMGRRNGRLSRLNVLHAQLIEAIAGSVQPGCTFGAVSPFAPQARLLQALVEGREGHAASTVHRFQGGERDVMAWDMTEGRAGRTRINRWFDAATPDEEGARLMNVALSRARDQLYIVADVDRVRSACNDTSSVRRMLDMVSSRGTVVDALDFLSDQTSRTALSRARDQHPLTAVLAREEPWLVLWCAEPPRSLAPEVELELAKAIHSGMSVYVRSGVPDQSSHQHSLTLLQRLGCHVQLVRPCRENLIISPSGVTGSNGNLVSLGDTQPWLHTASVEFSGVVLRMVSRRRDSNPVVGEADPLCDRGHPLLVDHGRDQDFRGRCLSCQGDVTANVRTGRSRSRSAASSVARCNSCGEEYALSGWCGC